MKKEAMKVITEYMSIFAMSNMDLGKTSLVKHSLKEAKEHLKEMLKIGAIWPS